MYPSCCYSAMPLPPAIGADDLAGLEFIYPVPRRRRRRRPARSRISPTSASYPVGRAVGSVGRGHRLGVELRLDGVEQCRWVTVTSGASGTGTGAVDYSVAANTGAARSGTLTIAGQTFTVAQDADIRYRRRRPARLVGGRVRPQSELGDRPRRRRRRSRWRRRYQPAASTRRGTHPRGFVDAVSRRRRGERVLLAPRSRSSTRATSAARTLVRIQPQGRPSATPTSRVPARHAAHADVDDARRADRRRRSRRSIESDALLVVDRTMTLGRDRLRRARGNRGRGAVDDVVPRRRVDVRRLLAVLSAAESERGAATGDRALPAAGAAAAGRADLHAAAATRARRFRSTPRRPSSRAPTSRASSPRRCRSSSSARCI